MKVKIVAGFAGRCPPGANARVPHGPRGRGPPLPETPCPSRFGDQVACEVAKPGIRSCRVSPVLVEALRGDRFQDEQGTVWCCSRAGSDRSHAMTERPKGMSDYPEQLREPIIRAAGSTLTERRLARLADRTFLNLWSYPNPFRDEGKVGNGDGKELCDLLVVCDPYVIIFSEKNIAWTDASIDIAWRRWFRRAVSGAATQLHGAERWLDQHPDRIFLDHSCTSKLPLALPPADRRRVHRIVVASGAADASRRHFEGGSGSLVIVPGIKGRQHVDDDTVVLAIGDVDPEGDFVHVFDETSFEVVLRELDTITDLTGYLDKRARFLRSGHLSFANGEEDLLAYYAIRTNEHGEHDFTPPEGRRWDTSRPLALDGSHYAGLISNPQYIAKKRADEVSYAWDSLIGSFTGHLLAGTTLVPPGHEYSLTNSEIGLRHMAMESRVDRRGLSEALLSALKEGEKRQVFFRAVMWPMDRPEGTAYFFLTVRYERWMDEDGGYDAYRLFRSGYAEVYAKALLMKHPTLERVVGIATEPPNQGHGSSEDCLCGEQREWTQAERADIAEMCKRLRIMTSLRTTHFHQDEYPSVDRPKPKPVLQGNRRNRRAKAAQLRSRRSSPPR